MISPTLQPKVSILLLNWNGINFTRHCLKALLKTNYNNCEIILIDNGSQNNEGKLLEKEFSSKNNHERNGKFIRIIQNPYNLGYAEGMNYAYKYATGKYIMFVNNDMDFDKNWLSPLVKVLEKDRKIGACQPKLISITNKKKFDYASAAGGFVDIFGYPFARGRIFTHVEKDRGQYEDIVRISWNGIFIARKKVLEETGLFYSVYFNYGEDMDLCFRIYGKGYIIVNVPKSIVYHYSSGTLGKDMVKKMFFHHRNNLILIIVNWPMEYLFFALPIRIILDFLAIGYYLVVRFPAGAIGVCKAYISLLQKANEIYTVRKKAQKIINPLYIRKNMPIYKGSIILQHFLRGKKTFRQIIKDKKMYIYSSPQNI